MSSNVTVMNIELGMELGDFVYCVFLFDTICSLTAVCEAEYSDELLVVPELKDDSV